MSDSLKDQLLQAGFKETKKPAVRNTVRTNKNHANGKKASNKNAPKHALKKGASGNDEPEELSLKEAEQKRKAAEIAEASRKKAIKAEVRQLIEKNKLDKYRGDVAYSYLAGKRIKQLFVTDAVHKQLVTGDVLITRLNAATCLIPTDVADKILALNSQWVVIRPAQNSLEGANKDDSGSEDEYADYQVPDDLKW